MAPISSRGPFAATSLLRYNVFFLKKNNTFSTKLQTFSPNSNLNFPPSPSPHQGCDHVSQLEETVREVRKKFPKGRGDESTDHATEYAKYKLQYCVFAQIKYGDINHSNFRFYSLYEWRLRRAAMLPPRTVPK